MSSNPCSRRACLRSFAFPLLPAASHSARNLTSQCDPRFVSLDEHISSVGSQRALHDLREGLFPITRARFVLLDHPNQYAFFLRTLTKLYGTLERTLAGVDPTKLYSILPRRATRFLVPGSATSPPIRHWWLAAFRPVPPHASETVYYVTTEDPAENRLADLLIARVNYRLHAALSDADSRPAPVDLLKTVNREVLEAMNGLPA